MKPHNIIIAAIGVLVLLSALVLGLLKPRTAYTGMLAIRFTGFSNTVPSAFTSTLPAHYGDFIREWLSSGTNVALFRVTNEQPRNLIIYPYAGFFKRTNAARSHYETVLPGVPDAYGIFLRPGQSTTFQVAIIPQKGPGMVRIGYSADYYHFVPRLVEELRGLATTRRRPTFGNEWIYSEPITP